MISQEALKQLLQSPPKEISKYRNNLQTQNNFYKKLLSSYCNNDKYDQLLAYLTERLEDIVFQKNVLNDFLRQQPEPIKQTLFNLPKLPPNKSKYTTFGTKIELPSSQQTRTLESDKSVVVEQQEIKYQNQTIKQNIILPAGYEETDDKSKQCIHRNCKGVRYLGSHYCRYHYDEDHHNSK